MTSANMLILILVGTVVGAVTGLALGGMLSGLYLAVVCGFLATLIAGGVRNTIMRKAGFGPDDTKVPTLVLVYSAVASLGGSALGDEIVRATGMEQSVWLGALAGLFSTILLAMLMITYYMNPETGRPHKRP